LLNQPAAAGDGQQIDIRLAGLDHPTLDLDLVIPSLLLSKGGAFFGTCSLEGGSGAA
jgi:hypothetical protein